MPQYNIIYTSPHDEPYLWNGTSLDELETTDQKLLRFSGKTFAGNEVEAGIAECKHAARKMFPNDEYLKVNAVEVKVV